MAKELIVSYLPFEITPQQINESLDKNDGRLIVSGVLQRADSKNQNGRVYPKDTLMREAKKYSETFIKERTHSLTGKVQKVGIDDACAFLAKFENGSLAIFESTRYARGHKALYTFEINGENSSIAWDLHDLHRLKYFDHSDESIVRGWRDIHVTDGDQPYMDKWWVPGLNIGFEHSFTHGVADFLASVDSENKAQPDFRNALQTQKVCEAVINSGNTRQWHKTNVEL